jgi:hypothetical protein
LTTTTKLGRTLRVPALAAVVAAVTLGVTACGSSFDSAASGDNLIKDYIKKYGNGTVSLKSVSCPSGIKLTVGGTYNCKVVLHSGATNKDVSGTITIHMIAGNKVEIRGAQDLHFA